jgi:hypothetical protein
MFVMRKPLIEFTEDQLREAIAASLSWSEALRRIGYCPSGGNPRTIQRYVKRWSIDTSHFDPDAARRRAGPRTRRPLEEILVRRSTYARGHLKKRLYRAGLKQRRCEMCGQGEEWRGARMSLILDHINGERDDHRLENLRIVCPNCAATLPTHCGKGLKKRRKPKSCEGCGVEFEPRFKRQKFCSLQCGQQAGRIVGRGYGRPRARKVERPPYRQLLEEIEATSYSAVAREYGVSDTAVRKWVRFYEREQERLAQEGGKGGPRGAQTDAEAA